MTPHRPRAHLLMAQDAFALLFDDTRLARLSELAALGDPPLLPGLDDAALAEELAATEILITSWGAPRLDSARLARMPRLRAVLHAAGTVRDLVSDEVWDRGILVTSAADANAIPVAEFTFAAIVLSGKGALRYSRNPREHRRDWIDLLRDPRFGNLGRTIGVVGFSRIGRRVVDLLRGLDDVDILVADPFADPARVAAAGARLLPLAELLPRVDVLSLHAPALPSTHHMIGAAELAALRDGATLVNTARGSLVDHDALLAECTSGRIDAVLDVTDPEPLPASSPLYDLDNVTLTPHIAGSLGGETRRLADAVLAELAGFVAGDPARHPVIADDLGRSA